jgi:hypothetical protein
MSIQYQKKIAIFQETIGVEEAEGLLEWLLKNPKGRVNLANCQHLHAANLQVLMAAKPAVAAWPRDISLRAWLESALKKSSIGE